MANEKILVVDDDKNICELLRLYLVKEGFAVTLAHDGKTALQEFDKIHPDMVLLDVMMPDMDGWEVCRRIRQEHKTPIIMLTAKGSRRCCAAAPCPTRMTRACTVSTTCTWT